MKNSVVDIVSPLQIQEAHKLSYGNFYFLSRTIVAEISEGIIYDWSKGKHIIDLALDHYGLYNPVHYISNRIYDYTIRTQDWTKFISYHRHLASYCVVSYAKTGVSHMIFERIFFRSQIHHFSSLQEALHFVDNFK